MLVRQLRVRGVAEWLSSSQDPDLCVWEFCWVNAFGMGWVGWDGWQASGDEGVG